MGENMTERDYFTAKILEWSVDNLIDYPWRKFNDPYEVLIAEILLRKTNAGKVVNIIEETLSVIPDLEHLEQLGKEELQILLKPYGMSKMKAQQFKVLAEQLRKRHGGKVPDSEEDLLNLYGVGQYICNAVLCFAYNRRVGILDTNIIRVITRYFGYKSSSKRPRQDRKLWDYVNSLVPQERYKDFNYALLDFGSKVCKAAKPLCEQCSISCYCDYIK